MTERTAGAAGKPDPGDDGFEGWAILEIMGHRMIPGRVRKRSILGAIVIEVEIPHGDGFLTQFYNPSALFALTPCPEDVARKKAAGSYDVQDVLRLQAPTETSEPVFAIEHGESE